MRKITKDARMDHQPSRFRHQAGYVAFVAFMALCLIGGGGSRADMQSLPFVRLGAILLTAFMLLWAGQGSLRRVRTPLILLALFALLMIIQLIPLPPALWMGLPGHAGYSQLAEAAGIDQPWRPISITPDLTLNSLLALAIPAAALVTLALLPRESTFKVLPLLIAGALSSALIGVAQMSGDAGKDLYLYRITNFSAPVGFFANRNHQAAFLAMGIPMLALWAASLRGDPRKLLALRWTAFGAALFIVALGLATGSRMGVVLQLLGMAGAFALLRVRRGSTDVQTGKGRQRILTGAGVSMVLILGGAMIARSRAESIQRLFASDSGEDLRFAYISYTMDLAGKFFPFGSGFGSFDAVFREVEPRAQLGWAFFNHAHNDLIELAMNGGIFALGLLAVFLLWWFRQALRLWRGGSKSRSADLGRLGSILTAMLMLSSLVDYPLRTPTMALIFAISCFWMCGSSGSSEAREPRDRNEADDSAGPRFTR